MSAESGSISRGWWCLQKVVGSTEGDGADGGCWCWWRLAALVKEGELRELVVAPSEGCSGEWMMWGSAGMVPQGKRFTLEKCFPNFVKRIVLIQK